jgi:hypothetical protein
MKAGGQQLPTSFLVMTDADCVFTTEAFEWLRDPFASSRRNIAAPLNVVLNFDPDPEISEGIADEADLLNLLAGELARTLAVAEGLSASHREQRRWIGMGIAFMLQSAIVVGGFPCGWRRREDHYFGRMMEVLQEEGLGSIAVPPDGVPQVIGLVRGSSRTTAGLAISSPEWVSGEHGLEELRAYAARYSVPELLDRLERLPTSTRDSILARPSTRLLFERMTP